MFRPTVVKRILARQQRDTCRRTNRHRPGRVESQSLRRQPIDVWRLVLRPVTTDPVPADIVGHDQNDVRLVFGKDRRGKQTEENGTEYDYFSHGSHLLRKA